MGLVVTRRSGGHYWWTHTHPSLRLLLLLLGLRLLRVWRWLVGWGWWRLLVVRLRLLRWPWEPRTGSGRRTPTASRVGHSSGCSLLVGRGALWLSSRHQEGHGTSIHPIPGVPFGFIPELPTGLRWLLLAHRVLRHVGRLVVVRLLMVRLLRLLLLLLLLPRLGKVVVAPTVQQGPDTGVGLGGASVTQKATATGEGIRLVVQRAHKGRASAAPESATSRAACSGQTS